jgi:hypothetical protein
MTDSHSRGGFKRPISGRARHGPERPPPPKAKFRRVVSIDLDFDRGSPVFSIGATGWDDSRAVASAMGSKYGIRIHRCAKQEERKESEEGSKRRAFKTNVIAAAAESLNISWKKEESACPRVRVRLFALLHFAHTLKEKHRRIQAICRAKNK